MSQEIHYTKIECPDKMLRLDGESGVVCLRDLEDGQFLEGDSYDLPSPPQDFDFAKFHRGRLFFKEHIFSCSIGMFFSLIIGMCFPNLLDALVFTKNSNTPKKAFKRYIQTFNYVCLWHYGDVWQVGSEANKSVLFVRQLHRKISQRMKETINNNAEFISQYDMGVVQSGFMGCIVMYSHHLGIMCSPSDISDYVYFWYGIGHLLGIKKEFNICAHGTSQAISFCKDIEDIVCKNLQNPPPQFKPMSTAVIEAFRWSSHFTLQTLPVITSLSFDAMSRKHEPLSVADTVRFYQWKFIFYLTRHFMFVRNLLRFGVEKVFGLTFSPIANCNK